MPKRLDPSFWGDVDIKGPDDCWEWRRATCHRYGITVFQGRRHRAHRVAYELTYGPFSSDLDVLHRCDNPPCCNPAHLWLGTQADNNRDMAQKGRNRSSIAFGWFKKGGT